MFHNLLLCVDKGFLLCLYEALDQTCESSCCWNMLLVSLLITGMQVFHVSDIYTVRLEKPMPKCFTYDALLPV